MSDLAPVLHEHQHGLLWELAYTPDDHEVPEWTSLNDLLVRFYRWRVEDPIEVDAASEIEMAVNVLEDAFSRGFIEKYETASVRDTLMRVTSAGQTALSEWNVGYDAPVEERPSALERLQEPTSINSSLWTGLSDTIINDRNAEVISKTLDQALASLGRADALNSDIMQAAAFLRAAKALVDAPDPPSELIWTLIGRAADIVGLVGLFYTILFQALN